MLRCTQILQVFSNQILLIYSFMASSFDFVLTKLFSNTHQNLLLEPYSITFYISVLNKLSMI